MAKSKSLLALIGGIIIIAAVILGLVFEFSGWWVYGEISGGELETTYYLNAFGGGGFLSEEDNPLISQEINYLLPGLLALIGGILLITQNKALSFVGSIVSIAGLIIFLLFFVKNVDGGLQWVIDLTDKNMYWDKQYIIGDNGFYWQLGYGYLATAAGSLIGLIGSFTVHESR